MTFKVLVSPTLTFLSSHDMTASPRLLKELQEKLNGLKNGHALKSYFIFHSCVTSPHSHDTDLREVSSLIRLQTCVRGLSFASSTSPFTGLYFCLIEKYEENSTIICLCAET